jgi:predicted phosphodiesterase
VRYLVLSDIHANWEALEAVLRQARGKYDRTVCCGDLVGYGADPDVVTEWVRANVADVVRGNHDKACAGIEDLEWFNPVARISAMWTQVTAQTPTIAYLKALPKGPESVDSFQILHGSPLDEDEYVLSEYEAAMVAPYLDKAVSFFGHTHVQGGFWCHRNGVRSLGQPAPDSESETLEIENDINYLINPGSVGQPRDGDPRAAYAIYEPEQRMVTFWRTAYDIRAAQEKILNAGLPDVLAYRLESGS